MENLTQKSDDHLLEILSDGSQTGEVRNEIKKILKDRKVEFEDFDDTKSSNTFSPVTVGAVVVFLIIVIMKIIRYFNE